MKKPDRAVWTLALCIALLPPIWAVAAPYIGVQTGAVALICAGLYSAGGDRRKALPMTLGFLAGDGWGVLALLAMEKLPLPASAATFLVLFGMGGAAVLVASALPRVFFLPAWLCGWAIALTVMGPVGLANIGTLPWQIAAAMVAGVWYVGVGVEAAQSLLLRKRNGPK